MSQSINPLRSSEWIKKLLSSQWRLSRRFVSLKDGSTIGTASGMVTFSIFNDPNNEAIQSNEHLQYFESGSMIYAANKSVSIPFKKQYLIHISDDTDSVEEKNDDVPIAMNWYFDIINEPNANIKYKPSQLDIGTLFVSNNFFIGFEFNGNDVEKQKQIQNKNPHLCDKDLYEGTLQFMNSETFHIQYHVNGPSKMYSIHSTFTLVAKMDVENVNEQIE